MKRYLFFDHASTTQCCSEAAALVQKFAVESYGNPSSAHHFGQQAARAIREARVFFAQEFGVSPEQVIFTGSGSEADNLAIYGVAMSALVRNQRPGSAASAPPRVLFSAIEHPAVKKTALSLSALGVDVQPIPVDSRGQIRADEFQRLLTPETVLVSIQQVNNIMGAILPVEELAAQAKARVPRVVFHTDAVQSFGKVPAPRAPSPVDLVSVSAHKIQGPKGVGALLVLNRELLKNGLRPLVWGGEQEGGFRSGTQNAGLIAGFHAAAAEVLSRRDEFTANATRLRRAFRDALASRGLLAEGGPVRWNSPEVAVPHIVSLSVPGYPPAPLAKLLEERGFLVSTGSACSSQKAEPDAVLAAMGLPSTLQSSAIRVSFSGCCTTQEEVEALAGGLEESITLMRALLGGGARGSSARSRA
jgi:cysteine desulfurase